jgi:hypothetical protein
MSRERHIGIAVRPGTARADGPAHTARAAGHPGADWVYCPECGMPAWVEWSDAAPSTSGPVEHVKIRCFSRHWFLLPRERLDQ